VPFDSEHLPPVGIVNAAGAFTITSSGVYEIAFGYQSTSQTGQVSWHYNLEINGLSVSGADLRQRYGVNAPAQFGELATSATYLLQLNAGDVVEMVNQGPATRINAAFINFIKVM
jgi:hypothetical protein